MIPDPHDPTSEFTLVIQEEATTDVTRTSHELDNDSLVYATFEQIVVLRQALFDKLTKDHGVHPIAADAMVNLHTRFSLMTTDHYLLFRKTQSVRAKLHVSYMPRSLRIEQLLELEPPPFAKSSSLKFSFSDRSAMNDWETIKAPPATPLYDREKRRAYHAIGSSPLKSFLLTTSRPEGEVTYKITIPTSEWVDVTTDLYNGASIEERLVGSVKVESYDPYSDEDDLPHLVVSNDGSVLLPEAIIEPSSVVGWMSSSTFVKVGFKEYFNYFVRGAV